MLIVFGIASFVGGLSGLLSLYNQINKASRSLYYSVNEEAVMKLGLIFGVLLIAGVVMLIIGIYNSKNKDAYNKMINKQNETLKMTKCPECGLNLAQTTQMCPKCGKSLH